MQQVFRIIKWSSAFNSLHWNEKKKILFDSPEEYKRKWKTLKQFVDRSTNSRIEIKISGEEFINGTWVLCDLYPEETEEKNFKND